MTTRAVTYARVSGNDRLKTGGENLAEQTQLCREYASKKGYQVVADLIENDRGASGATFDLPQLSEALRMAHAGEYDVLVVRELDRLSRDLAKQLVVEQELNQAGVTIEYVLYDFPDTPEGRLNKNLRAMLAEYEREKIRQRLMRGRRRKVKSGSMILHGHAAYGYKAAEKDGKTTIEIEEETAAIVKLIFQWYTEGDGKQGPMSIRSIRRALSEMKVPTGSDLRNASCYKKVTGYGEWNSTSLWRMLRNETYIGIWHYGAENIPVEVPAIISQEVWDMAQRRMQKNKKRSRRNTKYNYLLQSRLRCADCHYMVRVGARKSRSGTSVRLYYYCQTRCRDLECNNRRNYRAEVVDYLTWEWIKELLSQPDELENGLRNYQTEQETLTRPLRNRLELVNGMIQEQEDKRRRILEVYTEGHISKDEFVTYQQRYDKVIIGLMTQREEILGQLREQDLDEEQINNIIEFAHAVHGEFEDAEAENDFQAKRDLIELFDVTGELASEDGERVLYLHCIVGDKRVPIVSQSTSTGATPCTAPTGTATLARR